MSADHNFKTFEQAYEYVNSDHKKFKSFYNDKRLTLTEKNLLKTIMLVKKLKMQEALENLDSITPNNDYLQAYKCYFYGIIYNHIGQYQKAGKNLVSSIQLFESLDKKEQLCRPLNLISMMYFNIRDAQRLKKYYKEFLNLKIDHLDYHILDLNYQIYIHILDQDYQKALLVINKIFTNHSEYLKDRIKMYYVFQIMIYAGLEDYSKCQEILKAYDNASGFKMKSNYKYIQLMLNYLESDEKTYVYKRDFSDNHLSYLHLKIIQEITLENQKEAKILWQELKSISPELCKGEFEYSGKVDLFAFALEKAMKNHKNNQSLDLDELKKQIKEIKSNSGKLIFILQNADGYINKHDMIELIWNESWTPSHDGRLRTLISRVQKSKDVKIENKDGKYKIAS